MKENKEVRQLSRELLRASFTDGRLDRGRISSLVQSLISKKPRNHLKVLDSYKRLLRLELEKRHVTIESASELSAEMKSQVLSNLSRKYGDDLSTEFLVNSDLLGGIRVRVGSDVWDGTVRNRLQRLQEEL